MRLPGSTERRCSRNKNSPTEAAFSLCFDSLERYPGLLMARQYFKLWSNRAIRAWLILLICVDAFCTDPARVLLGLWWLALGKRVRAKLLLAPLFGNSPSAFRYWQLRKEKPLEALRSGETLQIIALVDVTSRDEANGLAETLECLAREDISALLVTSQDVPSITDIEVLSNMHDPAWLLPVKSGDLLAPGAGDEYRAAATGSKSRVIYADDDLIDQRGRRVSPHLKPRWNAELFRHFDYLTGSCIVRFDPSALASAQSGSEWAETLVALAAQTGGDGINSPEHLPRIMHYRRSRPAPVVPTHSSSLTLANLPSVSVVIPTLNRVDLLRNCIEGLSRTDYDQIEVLIVDNGSDDPATLSYLNALDPGQYKIIRHPGPFNFAAMNNRAAKMASGHMLCLLNNDIEIIDRDWLTIMSTQAQRPDVGAVGAQLLYPDGRIQHAGVVLGIGHGAAHAHRLLHPGEQGYFQRHALPQYTSAVTAACMVVQKERYLTVGGLDEACLAVAFNDVDLCMKLNARGWQTLYEPRAQLIHHESVSRGLDHDRIGAARLAGELAALQQRWHTNTVTDPFHHPELSRYSERFVLAL